MLMSKPKFKKGKHNQKRVKGKIKKIERKEILEPVTRKEERAQRRKAK